MGAEHFLARHLVSTLGLGFIVAAMAAVDHLTDMRPAPTEPGTLNQKVSPQTSVTFSHFLNNMTDMDNKLGKSPSPHTKNDNLVKSLSSACVTLGLLYAGAGGKTAFELESLFQFSHNKNLTLGLFKQLISILQVPEIRMANTAYFLNNITVKKEYIENLGQFFNTAIHQVDFAQKESVVQSINSWVANKTEHMIKDLFKEDDITDDTKMILLNAIYLKAKWQHPFKAAATYEGDFNVSPTKKKKVQLMSQTNSFQYAKNKYYEYLVLPYTNSNLSMLIVLPNDHETFEKREFSKKDLDSVKFGNLRVELIMPKFKIESSLNLNDFMQKRVPTAFDSNAANLSGISDASLRVSKIVQKASIIVDEEGTEAGVASGLEAQLTSMPYSFYVDRPFHFFIQMKTPWNPLILFSGFVTEPFV